MRGNGRGRRRRRGAIAGLAAIIASAAIAASASAATIPSGDYVCSYSGGYAGTVNIKKDGKYTVNDGKKRGKYSLSRKTKILTFKTGDYKSFFGKYSKKSKGFDVFDKREGYYGWTCYRD